MHTLSGGGITVAVNAYDGGKITSVIACDREWLEPSAPRDPSAAYAGGGGWDECAPTVGECSLADGTRLLDHGDAWRHPWQVLESNSSTLTMRVKLPTVGVTLRRTIRSTPVGLRLDYEASTSSRWGVPFLWCAHPLFRAPTGTRIIAPDISYLEHYPRRMHRTRLGDGGIDALAPGAALKVFAEGTVTSAVVEHADGASMTLSWEGDAVRDLGLYWDRGLFMGAPLVAIEPSTGRSDLASEVHDELPVAIADHPLTWSILLSASRLIPPTGTSWQGRC